MSNVVGYLVFINEDASPNVTNIFCDQESVGHIMDWYGPYHNGDTYTVMFNGVNIPMDRNGSGILPWVTK